MTILQGGLDSSNSCMAPQPTECTLPHPHRNDYLLERFIQQPNHLSLRLDFSTPQLPDTFDSPVYLLLMAIHTVIARKHRRAQIAPSTYWGVSSALGPSFVIVPNMTPLFLPIPSVGPTAVLFGTTSVSDGMFSEAKLSTVVAKWAGKSNLLHLISVRLLIVTTLPCAPYAGFRSSSCQGIF
jgi:hypothetical protein